MKIEAVPTRYEITTNEYVYTANQRKLPDGGFGWTVHRRKIGDAPIPPLTYALTDKGWSCVINNTNRLEIFAHIGNVVDMIKRETGDHLPVDI